jgi:hypothetical protein
MCLEEKKKRIFSTIPLFFLSYLFSTLPSLSFSFWYYWSSPDRCWNTNVSQSITGTPPDHYRNSNFWVNFYFKKRKEKKTTNSNEDLKVEIVFFFVFIIIIISNITIELSPSFPCKCIGRGRWLIGWRGR